MTHACFSCPSEWQTLTSAIDPDAGRLRQEDLQHLGVRRLARRGSASTAHSAHAERQRHSCEISARHVSCRDLDRSAAVLAAAAGTRCRRDHAQPVRALAPLRGRGWRRSEHYLVRSLLWLPRPPPAQTHRRMHPHSNQKVSNKYKQITAACPIYPTHAAKELVHANPTF